MVRRVVRFVGGQVPFPSLHNWFHRVWESGSSSRFGGLPNGIWLLVKRSHKHVIEVEIIDEDMESEVSEREAVRRNIQRIKL